MRLMDGKSASRWQIPIQYGVFVSLALGHTDVYLQAPTIWTTLETWAEGSLAGLPAERQRFLKTHMSEPDNILEILLRLVRGERATPHSHNAPTLSTNNVAGPLLSVLTEGTAHSAQQTHVSLAVLAMFRMTLDFAKQASGEKGTTDAQERMGEIVRCLPTHLVHKSLDGIFREWKLDKKGNR
jgi:20S proteasome subunit alpha 6